MGLFVYGTLLVPAVTNALIGRSPQRIGATLHGYERCRLAHRPYPGIVAASGSTVGGVLCAGLSTDELKIIDTFEGPEFLREVVSIEIDHRTIPAWVYVIREEYAHILQRGAPWSLERFVAEHSALYAYRCRALHAVLE